MGSWFALSLITLFLWGFWSFFPKLATAYLDPRSVLVYAIVGNLLVAIGVFAALGGKLDVHGKGITFALLAGICGALGLILYIHALKLGKTAVVITLTALYPLVGIVLSCIFLKEPITLKQGVGMVFAIIAMVLFYLN
jgi:transporter family protein